MTTSGAATGRLLCAGGTGVHGKRQPIMRAAEIRVGTVDELVAYVEAQDRDDVWRYTIVTTADSRHIKGAELRALLRPADTL